VSKLSEDCLYLNVWTPGASAGKRPVYFFIHGGAYQGGSGELAAYNGAALARKGAVVVTINYRLGLFGFLAHRELSKESSLGTSGNYGLLDTIEALRWVRANIGRFGGDSANVTIAGQSAGSGIVNQLLVSPLAKGLFHRAVLESGTGLGLPTLPLAAAEAAGAKGASFVKAKDIAALRAIPAAELMAAKLPLFPLPIIDGQVIPGDPENPATPIQSKVPTIIGFTRDDTEPTSLPKTVAAFEQGVRRRYGDLADRFLAAYPHGSDAEAALSAATLERDRHEAALLLWKERTGDVQPAYAYYFERTFPGIDPGRYGAFHTAEVPYIFGNMDLPDARFTAEDRAISNDMQDRWIAFMRTGNPNSSAQGPQWRRVSGDPASVWRIAPVDALPLIDAERLDLFRAFVAQGGRIGLL
jgi:para-nitrobenzyl esterase